MRLFQNSGIYRAYRPRLRELTNGATTFSAQVRAFFDDRYSACHWLDPVLRGDPAAFFTNGDDEKLQAAWAKENGLAKGATHDAILLAQVEAHRAEVFYNMDPVRYQSDFLRRLPGCVKKSIAWRAAPSPGIDLSGYDRVVCNFPTILAAYQSAGLRTSVLFPAHDPEMNAFAENRDRPIDVLFVGGYSRHHRRRADVLEAVARLSDRFRVHYCLDNSRLTRIAESTVGVLAGLNRHRRPSCIRTVSHPPVFGRALYSLISRSKIVLNGAVDMAGPDRGNMRCFEALGCGALMVSDRGAYPDGMEDGISMRLYDDADSAPKVVESSLTDFARTYSLALRGHAMVREKYSKVHQWQAFTQIASEA